MVTQPDAGTRAITGGFALVLLTAAPLALVVSLFLLRLFRGAMRRSMMHTTVRPAEQGLRL